MNPLFEHVSQIFTDAAFLSHMGITLENVGPSWCETAMDVTGAHLQQHGLVHGGAVATLADHTCGGAARAAVRPGSDVITIELKINFLRPATTRRLEARGDVVRAGRTIIVSSANVYAVDGAQRTHVAACVSTLLAIPQGDRPEAVTSD
jgi:uncharacterized protein (TIGR00369 family)